MDILFAQGSKKETVELKKETFKDLGLSEVLENITDGEKEYKIVQDIITRLPVDADDIRYRQDIMRDFLGDENLVKDLSDALWQIRALKDYEGGRRRALSSDSSLFSLLEYLRELTIYINVLEELIKCLEKNKIESSGLKALLEQIRSIVNSKEFSESKDDIVKMHEDLSNVRGVIVGINLTPDLDIEHIASVDFVPQRLKSKYQLTDILLSLNNIMYGANQGNSFGRAATAESKLASAHVKSVDPQLATLTPLIEKHLKWHIIKIRRTMSKYIKLDSHSITEMYEGLTFYLVMARLASKPCWSLARYSTGTSSQLRKERHCLREWHQAPRHALRSHWQQVSHPGPKTD